MWRVVNPTNYYLSRVEWYNKHSFFIFIHFIFLDYEGKKGSGRRFWNKSLGSVGLREKTENTCNLDHNYCIILKIYEIEMKLYPFLGLNYYLRYLTQSTLGVEYFVQGLCPINISRQLLGNGRKYNFSLIGNLNFTDIR